VLTSNYLSYVHDNSLWLPTGPIDGSRTNLTVGLVTDLNNARFDSWLVSADVRRYLRTGLRTAFAFRGYTYVAGGARPQRVTIGGSYALRGYPRFAYVAGSRAVLGSAEWRFPLTDYLSVGFPFGEVRFPGLQGAFFADLGRAWSGGLTSRGYLGAYGLGLRMSLGFPLVLRLDIGRRYAIGDRTLYNLPRDSRGKRFVDFWFGYNY
jgi:hemolysin activation/secretion protein